MDLEIYPTKDNNDRLTQDSGYNRLTEDNPKGLPYEKQRNNQEHECKTILTLKPN